MSTNNTFDEAKFTALLEEALHKVRTEEDPQILTDMKKLFKKAVPFYHRSYVAAYLAKQVMQGTHPAHSYNRDGGRGRFDGRGTQRERPPQRRYDNAGGQEGRPTRPVFIAEEYATTIFIGIGRNHRVGTKDLITLLMKVGKLERERIGSIRNQQNYSFVQLFKEDADDVIALLNGYKYRGRTLEVNYARRKEPGDQQQEPLAVDTSQPVQEETSTLNTEESARD